MQGNDIFAVNGGSFTFTNASTINNGTLSIAGATVTANASLGVSTLNLSSGTLNGSGSVTVTNAYNRTGGTFSIGGNASLTQAAGNLTLANPITATGLTLNAGGTIGINTGATLSLGGGNLVIVPATGATLSGGTISSAIITNPGGAGLTALGSSTLNDVTLNTDVTISGGVTLNSSGTTLAIASGRALHLQGGNANFHLNTNQTVSGPGSILFEGADSNNFVGMQFTGQAVTLDGLTIGGTRGGTVGSTFATLNNRSVIEAATAGQTITVTNAVNQGDGAGPLNDGVLRANGGTLLLNGTWSNPGGTIDVQGGTLNLGGTFSNMGTFNRAGTGTAGTVNLIGTFNNAGTTFVFSDTTGVINLAGGTINGGTLQKAGSGNLVQTASSTLNDLTLDMDFTVPAALTLNSSGTTLAIASGRALHLQGGNANFHLNTNQTVSGPGSILFEGADSNNFVGMQFTGQAVTLDGLTIGGTRGGTVGSTFATLNNKSVIEAATAGQTITVTNAVNQGDGAGPLNDGVLRANGGTLLLNGTWSNPGGMIDVQGGTLNLGGTFSNMGTFNRAGTGTAGTVNLIGTFNNAGTTFVFSDTTGVINLAGGTINGGTLQKAGSGNLVQTASSTLNDLTLDMDFTVPAALTLNSSGTTLAIASGRALHLQGGNANFHLNTNQTVSGPGSILFEGADSNNFVGMQFTGQAVTLDGLTIGGTRGGTVGSTFATLNNKSVIEAATAGQTITVTNAVNQGDGAGPLNDGVLRANGGTLLLNGTWSNPGGMIDVQGGTLNLGGTFSNMGTFNRAGTGTAGTVNLIGTFNNAGTTFVFSDTTGVINLAGGTINGGTLQKAGSGNLVQTASSTLNDLTLDMDFTVPAALTLNSSGTTLAIASGRALHLQGGNANFHLNTNQTVSGPGSILFEGADSNNFVGMQFTGQAVTLDGLTIGGTRGGTVGSTFATLNNKSVIEAATAGQTITVTNAVNQGDGAGPLNDGVLRANGGTLLLNGTWSNPGGTIDVQGGTLNLGGTFSNMGTFNRAGTGTAGTVNLIGTFNNAGTTFVFSDTTGVINLAGGTINGGTLQKAGSGNLVQTASSTLNDLTLDMDFTVPAALTLNSSGTTLAIASGRALHLQGGNANFHLNTNQTVSGPGSILFEGADSNNFVGMQFTGQAVTLDGLTIGGTRGGTVGSTFATLNNRSVIEAATAGQTITVTNAVNQGDGAGPLNDGVLRANGGTLLLNGTWSNPGGMIDVQGGTLNLGGTFSNMGTFNRAGTGTAGTVNLIGTFNNAGTTFVFSDTTGVINLAGGTINGGTLQKAGSGNLVQTASSTLNDLTLDMDFTVPAALTLNSSGTTLAIASGRALHLQGGNANFHLNTNQTVSGPGSILFEGADSNNFVGMQFTGQAVTLDGLTIGGTRGGTVGSTFATLNNKSVIEAATAGQTITVAGSTVTNTGTLSAQNGGALTTGSGFTSNAGTINVGSGSNWSTTNTSITNTGTLQVGGTINVGTGTLTNSGGGNFQPGASPGLATVTGNLVLDTGSSTQIEISGYSRGANPGYDAINVSGNVTINSGAQFNLLHVGGFAANVGDTFQVISAGGTLSVPSGIGSVVINPPSGAEPYAASNQGTSFYLQRGTTFTGTVNVWNTDASGNWGTGTNWSLGTAPVAGQIVLIDRGAANPTVTVNSAAQAAGQLQNAETLTIASSGALTLDGASTSSGTINITGGTLTANNSLSASTLNLSSGTLNGTGAIGVNSAFSWSGGTIGGAGVLTTGPTSTSTVSSTATKTLSGRTWDNFGTVNWNGGKISLSDATATINNKSGATWNDLTAGAGDDLFGAGTFNNDAGATINANAPGLSNSISAAVVNYNGTVNVLQGNLDWDYGSVINVGGTINFSNGTGMFGGNALGTPTVNFNTGANLTVVSGTAQIQNTAAQITNINGNLTLPSGLTLNQTGQTLTVNGSLTAASGSTYNLSGGTLTANGPLILNAFNFSSGTLNGTGTVTLNGAGTWSGGTFAGNLNVTAANTLNINGGTKTITGGTLTNSGTINWSAGDIEIAGNATIANNASFVINGAVTAGSVVCCANATLTINNGATGTLTVAAGSGATAVLGSAQGFGGVFSGLVALNNTGLVDVQTGTLRINAAGVNGTGTGSSGSTYNVASGATLDIQGGTTTLAAGSNLTGAGTLVVSSGSQGSGTLNVNGADTMTGAIAVTGGTLTMQATNSVTASSVSVTAGALTMNNTASTNALTLSGGTLSGTGSLALLGGGTSNWSGGTFNGTGSLTVQSGATLNASSTGTLSTSRAVSNSGTISVNGGTLQLSLFPTNAGTINIASGATLSTNGNALANATTGIITGNGTLNLGGAGHLLTNSGTLQPGNSPGTLTINGDVTMTSSSVTNIEIQPPGIVAGTDYDLITVTGAANLNGTLNVTHLGGFTPSAGNSFQIMTYASRTGDFTNKNFPVGFGYATTANATNYTLSLGGAVTNTWQALTGNWETGSNWSLGHAPLASEDVVIPDVGVAGVSNTITVSTASQIAKSITNAEILDISTSAGGLTFTQSSSSTGTVRISGGTLTANAALTTNTLDMSSGLVNGTGSLAVTNSFTQTGGTINIGGAAAITQAVGAISLGAITANAITARAASSVTVGGALNSSGGKLLLSAGDATAGTPDAAAALTQNAAIASGGGDITLQNTGSRWNYAERRHQCRHRHAAAGIKRRRAISGSLGYEYYGGCGGVSAGGKCRSPASQHLSLPEGPPLGRK